MTIAIGDIHGCLDPLVRLIKKIPKDAPLVFLGDYIDRGEDSAGVIAFLKELQHTRICHFLKGNHEDMMLKAVDDPKNISLWLFNGGIKTLLSYKEDHFQWTKKSHRHLFLGNHLDFFSSLKLYYEDDSTIFVHAGINPQIKGMAKQDPMVMMWVRNQFFSGMNNWKGKQIIFGHTPTFTMGLRHNQIFNKGRLFGIDTGLVYGGYLTALDTETHQKYQVPLA